MLQKRFGQDEERDEAAGGLTGNETLRSTADSKAIERTGEEKISLFWRVFGGTILSIVALVSITLDPTFDTPEVLARYAATMRARVDRWRFLTGDTAAVARRFGLVHWAEEGVIVHNSQTAVIDRKGRLAAMVEGSQYRLEQLADLVRQTLAKD